MPRPKGYRPKQSPRYTVQIQSVKDYIKAYYNLHHFSPGNNEIAEAFGVSTSVAAYWLNTLEREGWIEPRDPKLARNIVPVELFQDRVPFPGEIS